MDFLFDLFSNHILVTALAAWILAQIIKTIVNYAVTKKWDFERIVGDGGMPSCHSATVCAFATITGIVHGLDSFPFAIATVLAIIVMHDARGVRRETGKQAVVIKQIADYLEAVNDPDASPDFQDEKLKELVGHTPLQVFVGAVFGIIVGLVSGLYF